MTRSLSAAVVISIGLALTSFGAQAQVGVPFTVGSGTYTLMWGSGTSGAPYAISHVIVDPTTPTTAAHVTSNGLVVDLSHWFGTAGAPATPVVTVQGPSTGGVAVPANITQWATVALGAPSAYGTSPGAVTVPSVNAFITNPVGVTGTFWQATQPVSQPTAANLNATVVGTGTFAMQDSTTETNTGTAATNTGTIAGAVTAAVVQINNKQVNGVTPLMGNGVSGTGSQRVNIASDNTAFAVNAASSPAARTVITLDIKTVTTGGIAVNAISAGHRTAGGFIQNPTGATVNLCINEIGSATGTVSAGDTTCIIPGQSYSIAPASTAVSVISSDSAHPFSGYGEQ